MQGPKNTDDIPDNSDVSINHMSHQLKVVSMTKDKKSFILSTTKLINIVELSIRVGYTVVCGLNYWSILYNVGILF